MKGTDQLKVELISIGDELTSGSRLDTNSHWLSQRASDLGLIVAYHTTVGDNADDHAEVLRTALRRSQIVISTGGLGPTADDLTRAVVARVAGVPLVRNPQVVEHIRGIFRRYGRAMPESNVVQADFPGGSQIIENVEGTAPGIDIKITSGPTEGRVFCLPGVPAEMKEMWHNHVAPEIEKMTGTRLPLFVRVIHCFGAGESHIESMLPDLIARDREPRVGITASMATISLRIFARAESAELAEEIFAPTEKIIRDSLGDLVFGTDDETLEEVVVKTLCQAEQNMVLYDLGLHGEIASRLSRCDSGGRVLRYGIVVPMKLDSERDLTEFKPEGLMEMADRARAQFDATYGVSIGPLMPHKDRQEFIVSICGPELAAQQKFAHAGHADLRLVRSVKQVLNYIRLQLRTAKMLEQ